MQDEKSNGDTIVSQRQIKSALQRKIRKGKIATLTPEQNERRLAVIRQRKKEFFMALSPEERERRRIIRNKRRKEYVAKKRAERSCAPPGHLCESSARSPGTSNAANKGCNEDHTPGANTEGTAASSYHINFTFVKPSPNVIKYKVFDDEITIRKNLLVSRRLLAGLRSSV